MGDSATALELRVQLPALQSVAVVSPPPPVLFVRHWKTHISPEVYQKGGLVLLGHVGGAVLGSGRGKDVHVLPPRPSAGLPAGSRG